MEVSNTNVTISRKIGKIHEIFHLDEIEVKDESEIDDKVLTKRENDDFWRSPHQWIIKYLIN